MNQYPYRKIHPGFMLEYTHLILTRKDFPDEKTNYT